MENYSRLFVCRREKPGFLLLGLLGQNWIVTFLATFSTAEMV